MTVGPSQEDSSSKPLESQFSILVLWNSCSDKAVGSQNFEILDEDSDTGGPVQLLLAIYVAIPIIG